MINFYQLKLAVFSLFCLFLSCTSGTGTEPPSLKDAYAGKFLIGTALNKEQITGKDAAGIRIIKEHFNAIAAENCMKPEEIHPLEDVFDFALADQFMQFGEENGMVITGHTLIWHSQLPDWFCTDENGQNVSPEILKERMRDHIHTVVGRYKGRIRGWDVVNEAIEDDGSYRKSKFYEILGEEFIPLAFRYAHEADPDAELYYNDYSMYLPGRREAVVRLVGQLKQQGIRIDAVGMQGHLGMDTSLDAFEESIRAFAAAGVNVMITEFDLSVLPSPWGQIGAEISTNFEYREEMDPYKNGLSQTAEQAWTNRMVDLFKLFLKYEDVITRVTMWGTADADSWKNDFPIRGRTDYPLLFDRNHQPKKVVELLIHEAINKQ
ncbi:MAG: endo-1,4-beta-xylanase [Tannerellaceae bacterium]|nr:endo-1,4-beta-xylanase [Tannerellaceae bacterium]